MEQLIEFYIQNIQLEQTINEDFKEFIDKVKSGVIRKLFLSDKAKEAVEERDVDKLKPIINKLQVPEEDATADKAYEVADKAIPEFGKLYDKAYKVLTNSLPQARKSILRLAAMSLVIKSSVKKGNKIEHLNDNLKELVYNVESEIEAQKDKLPHGIITDYILGWAVVGTVIFTLTLVTNVVIAGVPYATWYASIIIAIVIFYIIGKYKNQIKAII